MSDEVQDVVDSLKYATEWTKKTLEMRSIDIFEGAQMVSDISGRKKFCKRVTIAAQDNDIQWIQLMDEGNISIQYNGITLSLDRSHTIGNTLHIENVDLRANVDVTDEQIKCAATQLLYEKLQKDGYLNEAKVFLGDNYTR